MRLNMLIEDLTGLKEQLEIANGKLKQENAELSVQLKRLTVEIDRQELKKHVGAIVETEYFQDLATARARDAGRGTCGATRRETNDHHHLRSLLSRRHGQIEHQRQCGALLAQSGHRVGVMDVDIRSPGIHVLFGLEPQNIDHTLNDFLWGRLQRRCGHRGRRARAAVPGTPRGRGQVLLVPSSMRTGEIARILKEAMRWRCSTRASTSSAAGSTSTISSSTPIRAVNEEDAALRRHLGHPAHGAAAGPAGLSGHGRSRSSWRCGWRFRRCCWW